MRQSRPPFKRQNKPKGNAGVWGLRILEKTGGEVQKGDYHPPPTACNFPLGGDMSLLGFGNPGKFFPEGTDGWRVH